MKHSQRQCDLHGSNLRPSVCKECALVRSEPLRQRVISLTDTLLGCLVRSIDDRGRIIFKTVNGPIPVPESRLAAWGHTWD